MGLLKRGLKKIHNWLAVRGTEREEIIIRGREREREKEREVPLKLQELKRFLTRCQTLTQRCDVVYYLKMRHYTHSDNEPLHPFSMICLRGSARCYPWHT